MKRLFSILILVLSITAVPQAHAQEVAVIDLGGLGGAWSGAYSINDLGQVVGESQTAGGDMHAFRWTPEDGMVDIGAQIGGQNSAYAINDLGQIVGSRSDAPAGPVRAFLWTASGGLIDLDTLGGTYSVALDINNLGQAIGRIQPASGIGEHGFFWSPRTGMIDIGTLGGNIAYAGRINDLGQVVGFSETADERLRAFLWTAAEGMRDLGITINSASMGISSCINNRGQVAMSFGDIPGRSHAFLLLPDGSLQDLGTLGGNVALVSSINDLGQVVGFSQTAEGTYHAFLWSQGTGMIDLGTLGLPNSYAVEINNAGQIVGVSLSTDMTVSRALLWTPSTPQEQVAAIISRVKELLAEGVLARGEAMAMLAKLEAAAAQLAEGDVTAGCNVLQAFINHVTARMKTGKVPADEARSLIEAAQNVNGCG